MAAVPADAHAFADLPLGHVGSDLVDPLGNLVPRDARQRQAWEAPSSDEGVAVTNAASLHLDANLARTGLGHIALDDLERGPRLRRLNGLHLRHARSSRLS